MGYSERHRDFLRESTGGGHYESPQEIRGRVAEPEESQDGERLDLTRKGLRQEAAAQDHRPEHRVPISPGLVQEKKSSKIKNFGKAAAPYLLSAGTYGGVVYILALAAGSTMALPFAIVGAGAGLVIYGAIKRFEFGKRKLKK